MNRYVIGFLAFLGLGVLLLVLLFTGGHKTKTPPTTTPLVSYANTNATVEMVVNGPIVAPQNHNAIDVTVSQYSANFDLIQGYDGDVISSKTFPNSENSFKNLLYALYYAGYSKGSSSDFPGDIGLCPTGDRYDFYLRQNGQVLQHYWITNCSGNLPKTYNGDLGTTLFLFNSQIPDISDLASGANI